MSGVMGIRVKLKKDEKRDKVVVIEELLLAARGV
jgi:hypothetical protein